MSQESFLQTTATGSDINFTITTFSSDEILVYVDGVKKTAGVHYNINPYNSNGQSTVDWIGTAPSSPSVVRVVRQTDVLNNGNTAVKGRATFQAGSSVKAADLNNNQTQVLRSLQEHNDQLIQTYDIENGAIKNAQVNDSAAIAGTKISPDFGSQNITTDGNLDVDGTTDLDTTNVVGALTVTGNAAIDNVTVNENTVSTSTGRLILDSGQGEINIGGSSNDTINVVGRCTHLLPTADNTRDLGSGAYQWRDLYIDGEAFIDHLNADNVNIDGGSIDGTNIGGTQPFTGAFSTLSASGNVDFNGNLDVDGTTDLDTTNVDGTLTVTGNFVTDQVTINNNLISTSSGNLLFTSTGGLVAVLDNFSVTGNTTLGNSTSSDDLFIYSSIRTNLQPHSDSDFDLGTDTKKWKNIHVDNIKGDAIVTDTTSTSDTQVYSAKQTEALFLRQDTTETLTSNIPWSSNNTTVATTGAIDARIRGLVDDIGGFVPIPNELSFPNDYPDINNPTDEGTLISIAALSQDLIPNSSGEIAISNGTVGNSTVFIVGAPVIDGVPTTLKQGFGLIVETRNNTGTLANQYTFHRYVADTASVATVAANTNDIDKVAAIDGNVTKVADIDSNVTKVANIDTNVTTVASQISPTNNISTVAGKATEIGLLGTAAVVEDMGLLGNSAVIADMATIADTSGLISNIGTVAGNNTNVTTVAGINGNVTTVAGISGNVTTVAGNNANVTKVADIDGNVTKVANIDGNVTKVADIDDKVTTVANNDSNVTAVANNSVNISAAVSNASNINSAVANSSNINSVVANESNINSAVANSSNITTVANNNSNVTTVAESISNLNTTAESIANVNTTAGSIANVNTVATNITNVNNASTYLNNFLSLYLGTAASAPNQDGLGNPVTEGDLYFNTVTKQLQIFNGSVFTSIVDTAIDFAKSADKDFSAKYTASAGSNSINLGGLAVSGASFDNEAVADNRISLAKGSGTFNLGGI